MKYYVTDNSIHENLLDVSTEKIKNPEWDLMQKQGARAAQNYEDYESVHRNIINEYEELKSEAERHSAIIRKSSEYLTQHVKNEHREVGILELTSKLGYTNIVMPDVVLVDDEIKNYYINLEWISDSRIRGTQGTKTYTMENTVITPIQITVNKEDKIIVWSRIPMFSGDTGDNNGRASKHTFKGAPYEYLATIKFTNTYKVYGKFTGSKYKEEQRPRFIDIYKVGTKLKIGSPKQQLPPVNQILSGELIINPIHTNTGLEDKLKKFLMGQVLIRK